jgi:hypothetical protein
MEIRLGKYTPGRAWSNGVDSSFFQNTMDMLQEFTGWKESGDWIDIHDYFYVLKDGSRVRTSMFMNPTRVQHMSKVLQQNVDLCIDGCAYDVRVSLKDEIPVPVVNLPDIASPDMVRIKKRRVFALDNWRFELTQVWTGSSRGSAEQNQAAGVATYEIEIEFCGSPEYLTTHGDAYIATSMLLKVCNLLSDGVLSIVPAQMRHH